MEVILLDTGVIIGFLDRSDPFHRPAVDTIRTLVQSDQLIASCVSYAEVRTGAALNHHDETVVEGFFDDLIGEVAPVTREIARKAAGIRSRRKSIRMPDALIIATALAQGVDRIVTADAKWRNLNSLGVRVQTLRSRPALRSPTKLL